MKATPTPTSGAADLPEAGCSKHHLIHCSQCRHDNIVRDLRAENDRLTTQLAALAAGQATAAPAVVPAGWKLVPVDATDDMVRATDKVNFENEDTDETMHNVWHAMIAAAPAQPASQQGVAYAALPDEGEPWRGHKFKEVQRGCWRCDCGKTIKEVTSDQSTPASGGNYPVMPKRYTVDDDGEELFTAEKMRAFADATHTMRASHVQAPAETGNSVSAQADSGFDYKTAADFLSGKTVSDDALRKFVAASRGAHDARAALHAKMLSLQGELASREAEIALLKRSLLDAEAAFQPSPTPQADSVQEDAARYRLLRRGRHWSVIDGIGNDLLRAEALDAAVDAVRKQGASHDR